MRIIYTIFLVAFFMFDRSLCAAEPEPDASSAAEQRVQLKWLGNAGWEIRVGKTIILIDPFLTRREASASAEWKTDEEGVLNVIKGADYVFAGDSGNFIEENLKGLQPDVAILAENGNYDWAEAIEILRPKTVIIQHYDNCACRIPRESRVRTANGHSEWRTQLSRWIAVSKSSFRST